METVDQRICSIASAGPQTPFHFVGIPFVPVRHDERDECGEKIFLAVERVVEMIRAVD